MKSLKFNHDAAQAIFKGKKTTTWRIDDDKDLSVDDEFVIVDKVNPNDKQSWVGIGKGVVSQIIEKHLHDITENDIDGTEGYTTVKEMLVTFQQYLGDQKINQKTKIKIIKFRFEPYEKFKTLDTTDDKKTTKLTEVKLYADGGSRGNPGPSASGFVIMDEYEKVLYEQGVFLGVTTNNQAEYQALKLGLEQAQLMHAKRVDVYMDSLLVVNQMLGKFKVRNRDLWPIHQAIIGIIKSFEDVRFTHVPRELNKLADAMVNTALDKQLQL